MGVAHPTHEGRRWWRWASCPAGGMLALRRCRARRRRGGRGLAKLNPAPKQAYELVLTLKGAPGPFAVVEGVAQYDAINYADCGRIVPATGTAGRITSQEPITLHKVSENEYRGTFTWTVCWMRTTTGVASAIGR
jgi:hypothetical protein